MQDGANNSFSRRDFYYILFRHKVQTAILFFAIVLTVIAGVSIWPETYEARATILVKVGRENVSIPTVSPAAQRQVVVSSGLRKEDINSEIEILRTRFIIERVANEVGIDFLFPKAPKPETFFKKIKHTLKRGIISIKDFIEDILIRIDLKKRLSVYEKAVLAVQKRLSAKQLRNSDVIEVQFGWFNPVIAEEVLDILIDSYLADHSEAHRTSGGYEFFQEQVEVLEKRLRNSEDSLKSLKEREGIASYEDQIRLLLEEISKFKSSLKMTETELAEATTRIDELKGQLSSLHKSITTGFGTVYKEAEKELLLEEVREKALNAKKEKLEQHVQSYLKDIEKLNAYDTELKRLDRQIQIDEKEYLLYREELEEARISNVLDMKRIVNVRVIDRPAASPKPVRPKKLLIVGLGTVLSLIVAIAFTFMSEYVDHSIKEAEDVKRYLNLPLLASIRKTKRKRMYSYLEECGRLKNNILSLSSGGSIKTIVVVNSVSGEGCSTVALRLATTLARNRSLKVLLVDGNLKHPTLHIAFKLKNNTGLSDLVLGNTDISDALKKTELPNLFLITAGDFSGNPIGVLESHSLKALIGELKDEFDYLIFDSAPINTYPDAAILASHVDGVILVIHAGKTRWEVVQNARGQLEMAHATIIGVVLNRKKYVIPTFIYKRL